MSKRFSLSGIILVLGAIFLFRCTRDFSPVPGTEIPLRELTVLEKDLARCDNAFGLALFRELVKADPNSGIFLSPLSVSMALGMTLNGAAGTTEQAMRTALGLDGLTEEEINETYRTLIDWLTSADPSVLFEIANSIWIRLGFDVEEEFIQKNRTYFDADVRSLDFDSQDAPDTINEWVSDKTHGKIQEIIGQIDPTTVMFLINAIYYLGNWTTQFDKSRTVDDVFTTEQGESIPCRMMQMECDVAFQETTEFQAVDLPYGDGHFRMAFILPNPGVPLNTLIETFTPEKWQDWKDGFTKTSLTVRIPRFKLEWKKSLNDELASLGMGIAFTDRADFSRINPNVGLLISQVLHKSFVRVDEEGTEAAAVTVVEVGLTSMPPVFSADHPFLFVLYENVSNALLFVGKLVRPVNP